MPAVPGFKVTGRPDLDAASLYRYVPSPERNANCCWHPAALARPDSHPPARPACYLLLAALSSGLHPSHTPNSSMAMTYPRFPPNVTIFNPSNLSKVGPPRFPAAACPAFGAACLSLPSLARSWYKHPVDCQFHLSTFFFLPSSSIFFSIPFSLNTHTKKTPSIVIPQEEESYNLIFNDHILYSYDSYFLTFH